MKSMVIGMLAETPVHPGAGRTSGFVDLPVARESTTDYPVIVGSSVKGALRDRAREEWPDDVRDGDKASLSPEVAKAFGKQEGAGDLMVSDARLLLLPVRSLTGQYKWATCPYLLERLCRDIRRSGAGNSLEIPEQSGKPKKGTVLSMGDGRLYLEEREFEIAGSVDDSVIKSIGQFMPHEEAVRRLADQLAMLNDDDFKWFASYGLSVNARNALDEKSKTTIPGALWYEETLSPDSLFYTIIFERREGSLGFIRSLFEKIPYLQVGGNETVGQGWFSVKLLEG